MTLKHTALYLKEVFCNFYTTGSLCETSKYASKELCSFVKKELTQNSQDPREINILEVGAGSGSVTKELIALMTPRTRLTVCELNSNLFDILKGRLNEFENYPKNANRVNLFEGDILNLAEDTKYDFIVCSLPFLNFPESLAQNIFAKLARVSKPECILTYYEYKAIRKLALTLVGTKKREQMLGVNKLLKVMHRELLVSKTPVWKNITPINIYSIRINGWGG